MIRKFTYPDLTSYNSFSVKAKARGMVTFTTIEELKEILSSQPHITQGNWAVLGGGNNILFTRDYEGTLIHPDGGAIVITSESPSSATVRVEAGVDWDYFVEWSVNHGLWGAENLSHIPSQTGAAPVQNIGAYGAEAKDIIVSVEMLNVETLNEVVISKDHCGFGYRESIFKNLLNGKVIITAVNFILSKIPAPNLGYGALAQEVENSGGPELHNIRQAVINIRKNKIPDTSILGNAGSFFKNPIIEAVEAERLLSEYPQMPVYPIRDDGNKVKLSAGWLIDKAGWKGVVRGNAGVYHKQALIIVNNGGATGEEILDLAHEIQEDLKTKFGVSILTEVNIW